MEDNSCPAWVNPRGGVNEVEFCTHFLARHQMICVDGAFFTREGRIHNEDVLRKMIFDELREHVSTNLARKVEAILGALRLVSRCDSLDDSYMYIHAANGTFVLGEGLKPGKDYCRHRLPVAINSDAPPPERWLSFLDQLLEPEDILTLQEFMGYCLIPTNMAQKMLIITGRGGEGKSRIGVVMKALLGENMKLGSIAKVENSPFARADLEHVLLLVDDDLKIEAMHQTNYIKSIITAELPMDLEKKGLQSYQGKLYARFMAFGNGTLQALHDRSHGFFRRQIILSVKERDPNRRDDPFLGKKLTQETEGIMMWALDGLYRLFVNDFRFTISQRARNNMLESIADGVNIVEFMDAKGYFSFDPMGRATSRLLYRAYRDWCEDNSLTPLGSKTFSAYLKQNGTDYGLEYTTNIPIGNGRHARGFRGIRVCSRV